MSNPVPFDDMLDVAFAEIYFTACQMERERRIEPENTTEELARDCKQIAADYVERYIVASKVSEPCFYDDMYAYAENRLIELYPVRKKYDVRITANMSYTYTVMAKDKEGAKDIALRFMGSDGFMRGFRDEAIVVGTNISEVIEKEETK